jgi:apolipoprotein N-acyltransferase
MVNLNGIRTLSLALGLSLVSGLLMHFGWPNNSFFPLLFIGLIPLFLAIDTIEKMNPKWRSIFLLLVVFVGHAAWTGLSLRWLNETSPKTYLVAITIDSITLTIALSPLFFIQKHLGDKFKWIYFVVAWMTLEYFNQYWMLGAPYFILGGGFGKAPELIQMYEIIGIEGGSMFVLITNLSLYFVVKNIVQKKAVKSSLILLFTGLFPFVISLFFSTIEDDTTQSNGIKVVAVHSYLDTYHDNSHKFPERSVEKLWDLTSKQDLTDVELVVWPETIISNMGWINNIVVDGAFKALNDKLEAHPNLSVCVGGYGFSLSKKGADDPYSAFDAQRKFYYQAHNVAITMNNSGIWPIRSKEIFIPFQERIPFLETLPFLKNLADIVGSNTMISYYENGKNVHKTIGGNSFVPVLCFESTYPLRMAENAAGSEFIAILANENWNKDLSGSEQYLYSNVAIAIQSRTSIVRSSNSGISAIVNSRGEIIQRKKGKDTGVLAARIKLKEDLTFYESISGLLYKACVITMISLIVLSLVNRLFRSGPAIKAA